VALAGPGRYPPRRWAAKKTSWTRSSMALAGAPSRHKKDATNPAKFLNKASLSAALATSAGPVTTPLLPVGRPNFKHFAAVRIR
jgi:hypothetical protein